MHNRPRDTDPMTGSPIDGEQPPDSYTSRLDRIERALGRIERSINGDEERGVTGLRMKVDRLEQRMRLVWMAVAGAALAVITLGWNALTGVKHP